MDSVQLRTGIIGLGVGKAHAKGYISSPDADLVAVCDMNAERLQQYAEEWKVQERYTDYHTMLKDAKLDMVSVCLPNALHAEVSIAALEAGVNVVCEKPMAVDTREAKAMVAAAKSSGKRLMMSYNYRFRSDARWMRDMVTSGKLGTIYHVQVSWRRETGIPGWGLFGSKAMSGGGALIDLGVHVIDLAVWMMDFPSVQTISAQTRSLFGPVGRKTWGRTPGQKIEGGFDVDDGAVGFMRLGNGASMALNITWAEHGQPQEDAYRVELQGTEGTAILHVRNYKNEDTLRFYTEMAGHPVTVIPSPRFDTPQGHEALIMDLAKSIRNGEVPGTTGEQGLVAVEILEALYESSQKGREVVFGSSSR
ncbi:MAG: Gfo/Idh/MocA family oxidoreductase [Anaerolineae bacterium]|nr:Gfo/Idh/MocA family oxidoreductase [Anaerolineae bacterium]